MPYEYISVPSSIFTAVFLSLRFRFLLLCFGSRTSALSIMADAAATRTLEPAPPSKNIYVNKLSGDDAEAALRAVLETFGTITSLVMRSGKVGAYCFAEFSEQSAAEAAVAASPLSVGSDACDCEFRRSTGKAVGKNNKNKNKNTSKSKKKKKKKKGGKRKVVPLSQQVYLKGLGQDIKEEDIRGALGGFGTIQNMVRRKLSGEEGLVDYAFVVFSSDKEASACVEGSSALKLGGVDVAVALRRPRPPKK